MNKYDLAYRIKHVGIGLSNIGQAGSFYLMFIS